uniref:Nuclear receptor n=1 Tax=Pristionchus pacificus TaxID=54126 RepID=A0A2A6CN68_PRIPA|eukprot:PDM79548.1 nuclear receptor [Pristionchus pacificus]
MKSSTLLDYGLAMSPPKRMSDFDANISNRRRKPVEPQCKEQCRVCSDNSTGYHYGIPSCNGCKSFFRRTLLEHRNFVCESNGDCTIKPKTRKGEKRHQCRACRFQRCVEAGMNPNGIEVEDQVREVLQNAIKQQPLFLTNKLTSVDEYINEIVENLTYIEFRHQLLRRSKFNPYPNDPQTIIDVLQRFTTLGQPQQEMEGWPLEQTTSVAVMSLEARQFPINQLTFN